MDVITAALHLAAINDPATADDLKDTLSEALIKAFWTAAADAVHAIEPFPLADTEQQTIELLAASVSALVAASAIHICVISQAIVRSACVPKI